MKAALLLGAILLISLVMADDASKSSTEEKNKLSTENKALETVTGVNPTTTKSAGTMVSGAPIFFLLPLMWMVVHLLHM